ncbi:gluconokinase [Kitasatospora sp. NPDC058218]|uniref:gluconokinase n=1 Tax=Kitasatospora sp. NPDC058218 TaxID=3346385 RepID=UPI0036D990DC
MGVSASGKSTLGRLLARERDVPFAEGDDFHPAANIARMAAGHALTDEERGPWLSSLARWIRRTAGTGAGAVVSCSALKREYRDVLRAAGPGVWFLYLALDEEVAYARIARRSGHFMPPGLLQSQYDTLEPLQADEPGLTVDANTDPGAVLRRAREALARFEAPRPPEPGP